MAEVACIFIMPLQRPHLVFAKPKFCANSFFNDQQCPQRRPTNANSATGLSTFSWSPPQRWSREMLRNVFVYSTAGFVSRRSRRFRPQQYDYCSSALQQCTASNPVPPFPLRLPHKSMATQEARSLLPLPQQLRPKHAFSNKL